MVKKSQRIEGKNPTFLAFSHPDCFLPYIYICIVSICSICAVLCRFLSWAWLVALCCDFHTCCVVMVYTCCVVCFTCVVLCSGQSGYQRTGPEGPKHFWTRPRTARKSMSVVEQDQQQSWKKFALIFPRNSKWPFSRVRRTLWMPY